MNVNDTNKGEWCSENYDRRKHHAALNAPICVIVMNVA